MLGKILISVIFCMLCGVIAQGEYYAVIITGDTPSGDASGEKTWNNGGRPGPYDEFWNDTFLMWEALYTSGWKDDNIHVLFGFGNDWDYDNPDYQALPYGFDHITDDAAYEGDVEAVFDELETIMTEDDFLFVFTFDHGISLNGHSLLQLMGGGRLYDSVFAEWVDEVPCERRVFYMQQCNSGGFIDDLSNEFTYIMTACQPWEWAGTATDTNPDGADTLENEYYPPEEDYYHHGEFDYHMFNATRLQTIIGNDLPEPDTNQDGLASLSEVWIWVDSTHDQWFHETPQFDDSGSIGDSTFLNIPPYKPTGLSGDRVNNQTKLTWNRNEDYDLDHYEIFKRIYDDSTAQYSNWFFLDETTDTTFTDPAFAPTYQGADTVWYKITAVDEAGQSSEYSDTITAPGVIRPQSEGLETVLRTVGEFYLLESYPDPFNSQTVLSFSLPEPSFVTMRVYDLSGSLVARLTHGLYPAGTHQVVFRAQDLPSGIYMCKFTANEKSMIQKMVLVR